MHMIHALQILATCMSQYHKSILPRAKAGIFIYTKIYKFIFQGLI